MKMDLRKRALSPTESNRTTLSSSGTREKKGDKDPSVGRGTSFHHLFIFYASLAGICGALSGVVGKVAVASTSVVELAKYMGWINASASAASASQYNSEEELSGVVGWTLLGLRILFFASNAFFTAQMWRYYIKSLALGPTPVCQIINTGTNFAVSAFFGIVFFGEEVTVMWAAGALLVVLGLGLVVSSET